MDIASQIKFINEKLLEHKSLTKVCSAENLRRSTIRDRFKRYGYELINGQYEMVLTPPEPIEPLKEVTNITKTVTKNNAQHTRARNEDILALVQDMQKELNKLKEEVRKLKEGAPVQSITASNDELTINNFTGTWQNRNFRVDSNVLKEFNSLCKKKKYSKYKKQDLLSQAILEFVNKYK